MQRVLGLSPLASAVALLAIYGALSLVMDPQASLGTDTGAKVASLEAMERAGSAQPDVGYWAERWDPDGRVHPIYQAGRTSDGAWVAVTTLPMLEAALPLYRLGGYRLALLLPMLGAVATACAARRLAVHLGAGDGSSAFWVVGLASPMALYALDLWEHSLGVAAILWALVVLLPAVDRPAPWRGLVAGLLLGAAATLRTEAIVYALVAVGTVCAVLLWRRRRVAPAVLVGALSLIGFAAAWLANAALEHGIGGLSRSSRATGAASSGGSRLADRIQDGLVTTLGVKGDEPASWLIGLGVVAVLGLALRASRRGDATLARAAVALAFGVYVAAAAGDLGFVPGFATAFPLVLGLFVVRPSSERAWLPVVIALAALPLVWAFQYVGAAGPQWGGRYVLVSSMLLGTVALVQTRATPEVARALIGLSAAITLIGIAWVGVRTRSVHDLFDDLSAVDADVVVVRDAFLLREGGSIVLDEHWLTASGEDTFTFALDVAERSGASTVAVVELGAAAPPPGTIPADWAQIGQSRTDLTGDPIGVTTFRLP